MDVIPFLAVVVVIVEGNRHRQFVAPHELLRVQISEQMSVFE